MKRAIPLLAVLVLAACKSSSSKPSGEGTAGSSSSASTAGQASGGECKNLAICPLLPSATVNALTGFSASTGFSITTETPDTSGPPVPSDECNYSSGDPVARVRITRVCNRNAATSFEADSKDSLQPGGERSAVTGVGDGASYQIEPTGSTSTATLFAYKGQAFVMIEVSGLKPGQDATAKDGMIKMATTIFK